MACLSDELLERHFLEPVDSVEQHVSGCSSCAARVQQALAEGTHFRSVVFPKTIDALLEPRNEAPWWRTSRVLFAGALAAAAIAVVAPRLLSPSPDYVGLKGRRSGLELAAFTLSDGQAPVAVMDGARLKAHAPLRFRVSSSAPCELWVFSVDSSGQVSRIFPSSGVSGGRVEGTTALPGGAVLDAAPGPERLFAVCGDGDVKFSQLEAAAEQLGRGDESVRAARALPDLPAAVRQTTLLLEKAP